MGDRRERLRVDVDCETLDDFAVKNFGSIKEMALETGVGLRTLRYAKANGFISLEAAIAVCSTADSPLEDVFGRQSNGLRNIAWMLPNNEPTSNF